MNIPSLGALVRNSYLSGSFVAQAGLYARQYVHVSQQSIGFKHQLGCQGQYFSGVFIIRYYLYAGV